MGYWLTDFWLIEWLTLAFCKRCMTHSEILYSLVELTMIPLPLPWSALFIGRVSSTNNSPERNALMANAQILTWKTAKVDLMLVIAVLFKLSNSLKTVFVIRSYILYNYQQNIVQTQIYFWEDYCSIIDYKHHNIWHWFNISKWIKLPRKFFNDILNVIYKFRFLKFSGSVWSEVIDNS